MDGEVAGAVISGIFLVSVIMLIKLLSDNKIRHKLIDKGMVDENIKYLYGRNEVYGVPSALKWGMVLIGVGLAFLIGQLVPIRYEGEVTVGCMFFFGGVGLVMYYFIGKRLMDREDK